MKSYDNISFPIRPIGGSQHIKFNFSHLDHFAIWSNEAKIDTKLENYQFLKAYLTTLNHLNSEQIQFLKVFSLMPFIDDIAVYITANDNIVSALSLIYFRLIKNWT